MFIRRWFLFLGAVLAVSMHSANANDESRLALLIGNSAYKSSPLSNPVNDVRLMENALKEAGFTVIKAENASIRDMRRLVRDFGDKLKAAGGVGLFYFAGHGVQVRGENFLVSTDSDIRNEDEVADDSINAAVILEKMQNAGNRMNLIVLDACRNNPFAVRSRSAVSGLANMSAPSGSLVAYSTAPGSVASDGTGRNGLYTEHLAKVIRQPGLPVEEVFKQVRSAVRRASNNQQTPWENTALEGQFFFKVPVQAVAPTPVPISQTTTNADPWAMELNLWDSVKMATNAAEFQAYLNRYPKGYFSDVAKARMAAISSLTSEKAAAEKVINERANAEASLKLANERSNVEASQMAAKKSADIVNLEKIYWDGVKGSTNGTELQTYLTQYPNGAFADIARVKIDELKKVAVNSIKPVAAPLLNLGSVGDVIGTLVLKDTLTGIKRNMVVTVDESDAEKTVYSSGDVVDKDGKLRQIRVGDVVLSVVANSLWTLPLKAGTSGDAKVKLQDAGNAGLGSMTWRAIAASDVKVKIEAEVIYRVALNNGSAICMVSGKWTAIYSAGNSLPESFSSNLRSGSGVCSARSNIASAELEFH